MSNVDPLGQLVIAVNDEILRISNETATLVAADEDNKVYISVEEEGDLVFGIVTDNNGKRVGVSVSLSDKQGNNVRANNIYGINGALVEKTIESPSTSNPAFLGRFFNYLKDIVATSTLPGDVVTIENEDPVPTEIEYKINDYIQNDTDSIDLGDTLQLTLTPSAPSGALWRVAGNAATVDQNGLITTNKVGSSVVTVGPLLNGKEEYLNITLSVEKAIVYSLVPSTANVNVGDTYFIQIAPPIVVNETNGWVSSDEDIATVDNYGNVIVLAEGTVEISGYGVVQKIVASPAVQPEPPGPEPIPDFVTFEVTKEQIENGFYAYSLKDEDYQEDPPEDGINLPWDYFSISPASISTEANTDKLWIRVKENVFDGEGFWERRRYYQMISDTEASSDKHRLDNASFEVSGPEIAGPFVSSKTHDGLTTFRIKSDTDALNEGDKVTITLYRGQEPVPFPTVNVVFDEIPFTVSLGETKEITYTGINDEYVYFEIDTYDGAYSITNGGEVTGINPAETGNSFVMNVFETAQRFINQIVVKAVPEITASSTTIQTFGSVDLEVINLPEDATVIWSNLYNNVNVDYWVEPNVDTKIAKLYSGLNAPGNFSVSASYVTLDNNVPVVIGTIYITNNQSNNVPFANPQFVVLEVGQEQVVEFEGDLANEPWSTSLEKTGSIDFFDIEDGNKIVALSVNGAGKNGTNDLGGNLIVRPSPATSYFTMMPLVRGTEDISGNFIRDVVDGKIYTLNSNDVWFDFVLEPNLPPTDIDMRYPIARTGANPNPARVMVDGGNYRTFAGSGNTSAVIPVSVIGTGTNAFTHNLDLHVLDRSTYSPEFSTSTLNASVGVESHFETWINPPVYGTVVTASSSDEAVVNCDFGNRRLALSGVAAGTATITLTYTHPSGHSSFDKTQTIDVVVSE